MMEKATTPQATWILGAISFAESSFFPLPPDLMMIPMIISQRLRAWWLATLCSVTSILGGLLGYAIGYYFFETFGRVIIELYNLQSGFDWFQAEFQAKGFWLIMAKGLTPIPFKLVTIASGATKLPLGQFLIASTITRTFRFFVLAGLLWIFGEKARHFIDQYLGWVFAACLAIIVLGVFLVKVIFA